MTSLEWWFTGDNYPNLALFPVIENWVYPQFWLFKKTELRNWLLLSNFGLGHFFKRNHWATTKRPWGFRRNEVSARDSQIMYSLWWRAQQIPPPIIRSKTQALVKVVSCESSFARHCHSTRSITLAFLMAPAPFAAATCHLPRKLVAFWSALQWVPWKRSSATGRLTAQFLVPGLRSSAAGCDLRPEAFQGPHCGVGRKVLAKVLGLCPGEFVQERLVYMQSSAQNIENPKILCIWFLYTYIYIHDCCLLLFNNVIIWPGAVCCPEGSDGV